MADKKPLTLLGLVLSLIALCAGVASSIRSAFKATRIANDFPNATAPFATYQSRNWDVVDQAESARDKEHDLHPISTIRHMDKLKDASDFAELLEGNRERESENLDGSTSR